jgi:hypothetical protein
MNACTGLDCELGRERSVDALSQIDMAEMTTASDYVADDTLDPENIAVGMGC